MITLIALFCCFENEQKSCVLCKNFNSLYKINRTLNVPLGIRILSSSAESISHSFASLTRERYFQPEKIKFVSPSRHVINILYVSPKTTSNLIYRIRTVRDTLLPISVQTVETYWFSYLKMPRLFEGDALWIKFNAIFFERALRCLFLSFLAFEFSFFNLN